MKDLRKTTPSFLVPPEEFTALRDGTTHVFKMPLNKKNLRFLPKAYEDAVGTMLIFPRRECPNEFSFHTRGSRETCRREVMNVIAYKEEDGSEIIKVRLK